MTIVNFKVVCPSIKHPQKSFIGNGGFHVSARLQKVMKDPLSLVKMEIALLECYWYTKGTWVLYCVFCDSYV